MLKGQINRPEFSPISIARALWKRKWPIALLWISISALTLLIVFRMQPLYSAESLVLVESQKIPENYVAATVHVELSERLDQLKQEVLSYDRLLRLIRQYDLYPDSKGKLTEAEIVWRMREDIRIALERTWSAERPGAFRVSYVGRMPTATASVVNQISHFFVDENLRGRQAQAEGTSTFLESQLSESKQNLEKQETRLRQFKLTYNGELPQQESALIASLGQGKSESEAIQQELSRAEQNKIVLENSLNSVSEVLQLREQISQDRIAAAAAASAAAAAAASARTEQPEKPPVRASDQLRANLNALRLSYGNKHPAVERAAEELAAVEAAERKASEPPTTAARAAAKPEPAPDRSRELEQLSLATVAERERITELKAQLAALDNRIKDLHESEKRVVGENHDVEQRLARLPIREQQQATVMRDYDISKVSYQTLLEKKLAADVASNMEKRHQAERFTILEEARVPEKPVRPRRVLLSFGGSLAGLFAALIFGLALELRANVFLGEWELPPGSVILARVPEMEGL